MEKKNFAVSDKKCNFAGDKKAISKKYHKMKTLLKYAGAIVVLLGVICLVVYWAAMPENYLLVTALVLETVGILGFILTNRFVE